MSDDATIVQIDSLVANEFQVEIDGSPVEGVFRVTGLVSFKMDGDDTNAARTYEPVVIAKMVQRDGNNTFNKWLRETVNAQASNPRPRRSVAIIAIDDGLEVRRWTIKDAWIREIRYSEFNSASSEMVEEIITIVFHELTETWPATPNLR